MMPEPDGGNETSTSVVSLRKLDMGNWFACSKLSVSETQRHLFRAPVVYWMAESKNDTSPRPQAS